MGPIIWTRWTITPSLILVAACGSTRDSQGVHQSIDLRDLSIHNTSDVRILNIAVGVPGLPSGNYRYGIDLIDSADVRQAKLDLVVEQVSSKPLRIESGRLSWRAHINCDIQIRNRGTQSYRVAAYGSIAAVYRDAASGEERVILPDVGTANDNLAEPIQPNETASLWLRGDFSIDDIFEKARRAGVSISESNLVFLTPCDGPSWRPNWPGKVTPTVGLLIEVVK